MMRRGVDQPFFTWGPNVGVGQDGEGGPSQISLPQPRGLNGGYLDVPAEQRVSYAHFPAGAGDPDRPVVQNPSPRSQWIPANNSSSSLTRRVTPE